MIFILFAFMLAFCSPTNCMQTNSTSRIETHRNHNGVCHYSTFLPEEEEVKTSIDAENYTIIRTLTRTKEGIIEEKFNGHLELKQGYDEIIPAKNAARLFTAFVKKYSLEERTHEEWLNKLKQKLL